MIRVYLSLGSNIDAEKNISAGLDELVEQFGDLIISSVFESEAVGFSGSNFYNLAVGIDTRMSIAELSDTLKAIETRHGRKRQGPKFSSRTLDIDILSYADFVGEEAGVKLPRSEITKNAFVLWPLAEIAPDEQHPALKQSYADLWAAYDKNKQALWRVNFIWQGKTISRRKES